MRKFTLLPKMQARSVHSQPDEVLPLPPTRLNSLRSMSPSLPSLRLNSSLSRNQAGSQSVFLGVVDLRRNHDQIIKQSRQKLERIEATKRSLRQNEKCLKNFQGARLVLLARKQSLRSRLGEMEQSVTGAKWDTKILQNCKKILQEDCCLLGKRLSQKQRELAREKHQHQHLDQEGKHLANHYLAARHYYTLRQQSQEQELKRLVKDLNQELALRVNQLNQQMKKAEQAEKLVVIKEQIAEEQNQNNSRHYRKLTLASKFMEQLLQSSCSRLMCQNNELLDSYAKIKYCTGISSPNSLCEHYFNSDRPYRQILNFISEKEAQFSRLERLTQQRRASLQLLESQSRTEERAAKPAKPLTKPLNVEKDVPTLTRIRQWSSIKESELGLGQSQEVKTQILKILGHLRGRLCKQ